MLTHHNLVANLRQIEGLDYFFDTDTLICVLPMFHIYGLVVVLNMGLYAGATIVTMPRFELESFLKAVQDYEVSLAHIVPPIVLSLSKNPIVANYNLPKLKTLFSGAAPLGADLTQACMNRLGCSIRQGYGMTETSPVTHSSPANQADVKLGSVGVPAPNTECKIVDLENGEALGFGQKGEVCVRGPQVMAGYWRRPDATEDVFVDDVLRTGDVGYADKDGFIYIVDRIKDLIICSGYKVYPHVIEDAIYHHPAVEEVIVVGVPDSYRGQAPKAYVKLKVGTALTQDELKLFLVDHLSPLEMPHEIEFRGALPRTAVGKLSKKALLEEEAAKAEIMAGRPAA
jgi:long-chain acyl-CoA synthetase